MICITQPNSSTASRYPGPVPSPSKPVASADERRHLATRDPWWGETWGFDFGSPDATLGGFVQIIVYPRRNVAWFWAAVVGEGRKYILCRDDEVTPPTNPDVLEVRGVSLWSHAICETPLEHWTVAMEAYAVELDDPFDALRGERGDRVGLAFDLEWESLKSSPVWAHTNDGVERYEVPCEVNGVLQIGDETLTVAYEGWRQHSWGRLDWSDAMLAGVRANGTGGRPRSEWTDSVTTTRTGAAAAAADWDSAGPMPGRHAVAHAPFLSHGPNGRAVSILRTFDRVISDGHGAPGWREQPGERR